MHVARRDPAADFLVIEPEVKDQKAAGDEKIPSDSSAKTTFPTGVLSSTSSKPSRR
jgi:hypothetical protein